jgi:chromosome segregation ATPase
MAQRWLPQCQEAYELLNGTYLDCSETVEYYHQEQVRLHGVVATVGQERDDALASVNALNATVKAKKKALKAKKKELKKEKEAREAEMAATIEAHTAELTDVNEQHAEVVLDKDATIERLNKELNATKATVSKQKRKIKKVKGEGLVMRKLAAQYMLAAREMMARMGRAFGF